MFRARHHLRYFCADAWDAVRNAPGIHLLATATLAAVLFLAGLVMLSLENVRAGVAERLGDVRVRAFLERDLDETGRGRLERELAALDVVDQVDYVDPDEALRRFADWDGESAGLAQAQTSNPLPASFELVLRSGRDARDQARSVAERVRVMEGVEEVRFDQAWLETLERLLSLARVAGSGIGLLVLAAVVFIMASVLRLAVYAREREIGIMLLIGASPGFIRGPFLVAGLGQGLIAGGIGLFGVELTRRLALLYLGDVAPVASAWLLDSALPWQPSVALVGVGLIVSLLGGYFAVRRRL